MNQQHDPPPVFKVCNDPFLLFILFELNLISYEI